MHAETHSHIHLPFMSLDLPPYPSLLIRKEGEKRMSVVSIRMSRGLILQPC